MTRELRILTVWVVLLAASSGALLAADEAKAGHTMKEYHISVHGQASDPRTPAAKRGCKECHFADILAKETKRWPKEVKAKWFPLGARSPLPAKLKSAVCITCHEKGYTALWPGSVHEAKGLSCIECHMAAPSKIRKLKNASQLELCARCHRATISQMRKTSHHPVTEGQLKCTSCHNPHGSTGEKFVNANTVNELCFKCHAEHRGPFLWEHAPATESCLTCHTPHGSNHGAMLKTKMPYLCQQCHSNPGHPTSLYARQNADAGQPVYRVLNNRIYYRACLNCHVKVHGSNHPSGKTLAR